MLLGPGLSKDASIWADKKIILFFSIAASSAWMDEPRPMMKGTKVDGKTTTSLKGIKAIFFKTSEELREFCILILQYFISSYENLIHSLFD
jgi:hypothetical protein